MNNLDKLGLFLFIVGLGLVTRKTSAKLARETGISPIAIGIAAWIAGYGLGVI